MRCAAEKIHVGIGKKSFDLELIWRGSEQVGYSIMMMMMPSWNTIHTIRELRSNSIVAESQIIFLYPLKSAHDNSLYIVENAWDRLLHAKINIPLQLNFLLLSVLLYN